MNIPNEYFFDRSQPAESWRTRLPHLSQAGKLLSLNFRLGDSLPQSVLKHYAEVKQNFIVTHPTPWDDATKQAFQKLVAPNMERYLDNGYGSCLFRDPSIRKILSDSMHHRNHCEYETMSYVIMPNHVHWMVVEFEEKGMERVMSNLMRFTSTEINRLTGGKGSIWQREIFDRYIRNESHYYSVVDYHRENPRYLRPTEYELGGLENE